MIPPNIYVSLPPGGTSGTFIAINNQASSTVLAYLAFTIGAVTDNGQTRLELDLADRAIGGPEAWRAC